MLVSDTLLKRFLLLTVLVHRLPSCDHIVLINKLGSVRCQGSYQELSHEPLFEDTMKDALKGEDQSTNNDDNGDEEHEYDFAIAQDEAIKQQETDLARKTGDWTVYKYYAQTIGTNQIILYLFLITIEVALFTSLSMVWPPAYFYNTPNRM